MRKKYANILLSTKVNSSCLKATAKPINSRKGTTLHQWGHDRSPETGLRVFLINATNLLSDANEDWGEEVEGRGMSLSDNML